MYVPLLWAPGMDEAEEEGVQTCWLDVCFLGLGGALGLWKPVSESIGCVTRVSVECVTRLSVVGSLAHMSLCRHPCVFRISIT